MKNLSKCHETIIIQEQTYYPIYITKIIIDLLA